MSQGFNHFDENGNAVMVDVSGKNITYRTAVATGEIHVGEAIMEAVKEGSVKKGDVLGVARVAGIIVETVPGIILLLLTKMTEAIGMADGIVLIQLGSICRDGQALLIFCLSLIYIFLYSMILYMLRRDRKRRIPYIPFLFLAYLTTWMI